MDTQYFLSEQLKNRTIGLQGKRLSMEIENGHIKNFAQAISDSNPLWNDEESASKGPYGMLIAPPTFLRSVPYDKPELPFANPFNRMLDGGSKWEYFQPVRAGDTITSFARISDVFTRSGKIGAMLFTILEIIYENQNSKKVAVQTSTMIAY
jgi:acyl dehydratase